MLSDKVKDSLTAAPLTLFERITYSVILVCCGCFLFFLFAPAKWWFSAEIYVPDFKQGQDVTVQYVRDIKSTQSQDWHAEAAKARLEDDDRIICAGHGSAHYRKDAQSSLPLPMTVFVGSDDCPENHRPGKYILQSCWSWYVGFIRKEYCTESNTYTVTARD